MVKLFILCLLPFTVQGVEKTPVSPNPIDLPAQKPSRQIRSKKQTFAIKDKSEQKKSEKNSQLNSETNLKNSKKPENDTVAQQIKKVFTSFLKILEKETLNSNEYAKAVRFLENSLYNEASFNTLKVLADLYGEKEDFKNQINVLNILSANYPNKPESFYLIGMAYKKLYFNESDNKNKNKEKAIENFNQSLKLDKKYILAYEALLELLKTEDSKTGEKLYTKEALSLTIDMLKNLRNKKYYTYLCKAYYDNKFLKQSQRTCLKAIKANPKSPINPLILALSLPDDKKNIKIKKLLSITKKFKESFFVQYKTALYFIDKDPKSAINYFNQAYKIQPNNLKLNKIMAQFLFDNKNEDNSYKHFLKACQLSRGKFLANFKQAKSTLRKKQMVNLILKFQKGIEKCFYEVRKRKNKTVSLSRFF